MANDAFNADEDDGRVKLTIEGVRYVLKRPKIKEFRMLREELIDLAKKAGATDDEADDLSRGKLDATILVEREDELFAWWGTVFELLEEKQQPFPPTDDLPAWILGPTIVPSMMQAWLNRPVVPGR